MEHKMVSLDGPSEPERRWWIVDGPLADQKRLPAR
jgi:hypothetical protein